MPLDAAALSAAWLANPWLLWGVGPCILSVNAGFFIAATVFELLLASRWLDGALLAYPSAAAGGGLKRRGEALAATHARIPWAKQLTVCIKVMAGPSAVANAVTLTLLMKAFGPATVTAWWPATAAAAAWQLLAFALLADFGLYWGHRVQHEFDALWRVHRVHHSIDTPTPYSTMYIHRLDATLQGGIPMALAAVILRPAPAILYLSFAARVAENAFNHSGIDHWLVDLVCLKTLPFRVSASWHDAHHKFCNHPRNARNYAESWVIWDWVFGTVQPRSGRPQGAKAA